ncbi:MAG: septal ring lytic transglycosylase RlpA family protein [Pseudolabrys sp.]
MRLRHFGVALLAGMLVLAGGAAEAKSQAERGAELRALVATINAKLRRWVKPTGKCPAGYTERLATFYWQGTRTANGERFDPDGLTAALRSRAFGQRLHVINPHNDRAVTVRHNDFGPATIAWIDLSRGAAKALGMRQSSYVCVR